MNRKNPTTTTTTEVPTTTTTLAPTTTTVPKNRTKQKLQKDVVGGLFGGGLFQEFKKQMNT